MLFLFGSVQAGMLLYDHLTSEKPFVRELAKKSDTDVVYQVKGGKGELSLSPCKLMAVELGPSADPDKATLQIVMNESVETECKPVTNIGKAKKYVKLTPTQYPANIVLKTKNKGKVPITA